MDNYGFSVPAPETGPSEGQEAPNTWNVPGSSMAAETTGAGGVSNETFTAPATVESGPNEGASAIGSTAVNSAETAANVITANEAPLTDNGAGAFNPGEFQPTGFTPEVKQQAEAPNITPGMIESIKAVHEAATDLTNNIQSASPATLELFQKLLENAQAMMEGKPLPHKIDTANFDSSTGSAGQQQAEAMVGTGSQLEAPKIMPDGTFYSGGAQDFNADLKDSPYNRVA